jgi:hypothetical protein
MLKPAARIASALGHFAGFEGAAIAVVDMARIVAAMSNPFFIDIFLFKR